MLSSTILLMINYPLCYSCLKKRSYAEHIGSRVCIGFMVRYNDHC